MVGWDPTMAVPWSKQDILELSTLTNGAGAWLGGRAAVPMHYLDEVDRGSWLPWYAITRPLNDQYGGRLDDDDDDKAEVGWAIVQASRGGGSRLQTLTSSNRILCEDPGALVPVPVAVLSYPSTQHAACLRRYLRGGR